MRRFLSLGAGVQSSTLALMIAHGELEPVDAAIFADTGWEPPHVYDWLDWLEKQLPYPVHRVQRGNLRDDALKRSNTTGQRFAAIPWHMVMPNGDRALGRRQCTKEYKIEPLTKKTRDLLGLIPRQRAKGVLCEMLIGISTDEAMRMKPSREPWKVHRWPLIDKSMSRNDCLRWMERKGYPLPPKSSCIGCPFHSDHEWRLIKADPALWADAVEVDKAIRQQPGMRGQQFMHRSCLPLDQVDLSTAADHGQIDMFNNECEGMCGVCPKPPSTSANRSNGSLIHSGATSAPAAPMPFVKTKTAQTAYTWLGRTIRTDGASRSVWGCTKPSSKPRRRAAVMRRNCPICGVESVGGKPHNYHLHQSLTPEAQRAASEAVRLGNKRTEYQREYYWRHAEKLRDRRREQKRELYRLRKTTKPLIEELCGAIDLARKMINW